MAVMDFPLLACDALDATVRAAAGIPETGVFVCRHRVTSDETSALVPHANNVAILSWIDQLASQHGAFAGASREHLARNGQMWFVAQHTIDYLGESFADDDLVLATWIEILGRTSLTRATAILRRSDGMLLVRAMSRWALVDLATRRPAAIAEPVRAALTV